MLPILLLLAQVITSSLQAGLLLLSAQLSPLAPNLFSMSFAALPFLCMPWERVPKDSAWRVACKWRCCAGLFLNGCAIHFLRIAFQKYLSVPTEMNSQALIALPRGHRTCHMCTLKALPQMGILPSTIRTFEIAP